LRKGAIHLSIVVEFSAISAEISGLSCFSGNLGFDKSTENPTV
jgi:hypothetical protein